MCWIQPVVWVVPWLRIQGRGLFFSGFFSSPRQLMFLRDGGEMQFGFNRCLCQTLQVIFTSGDLLQGLLSEKEMQNGGCMADVSTRVER